MTSIQRYTFRPRIVEAVRWQPQAGIPDVYEFSVSGRIQGHIIDELGRPHYIIPGVWIVREPPSTSWRPYSDEEFERTFIVLTKT